MYLLNLLSKKLWITAQTLKVRLRELISPRKKTYALRGKDILTMPKVNTTRFGLKFRRYYVTKLWDSLPNAIRASIGYKTLKEWVYISDKDKVNKYISMSKKGKLSATGWLWKRVFILSLSNKYRHWQLFPLNNLVLLTHKFKVPIKSIDIIYSVSIRTLYKRTLHVPTSVKSWRWLMLSKLSAETKLTCKRKKREKKKL